MSEHGFHVSCELNYIQNCCVFIVHSLYFAGILVFIMSIHITYMHIYLYVLVGKIGNLIISNMQFPNTPAI